VSTSSEIYDFLSSKGDIEPGRRVSTVSSGIEVLTA